MLEGDWGREERRRQICFRKRKSRALLKLKVKLGGVGLLKIQGRERSHGGVPGGEGGGEDWK